jgi:hypothetical protein
MLLCGSDDYLLDLAFQNRTPLPSQLFSIHCLSDPMYPGARERPCFAFAYSLAGKKMVDWFGKKFYYYKKGYCYLSLYGLF